MSSDLPAILTRSLRELDERGVAPRRLIIVVNLPELPPGGNARVVDTTHHLSFEDVLDDPGVLGAVAQFAVRKPDA